MEFTFHNSFIIQGFLPSTMAVWTEFSCWHKSYLNKAALLQCWCLRYINIYGRHHNLVDRYEISISQMTMDLFTHIIFFPLSPTILLWWVRGFFSLCFARWGLAFVCLSFLLSICVLCAQCCQCFWITVSLRFSQFSDCWLILSVYIIMSFDFPFGRLFGVR